MPRASMRLGDIFRTIRQDKNCQNNISFSVIMDNLPYQKHPEKRKKKSLWFADKSTP